MSTGTDIITTADEVPIIYNVLVDTDYLSADCTLHIYKIVVCYILLRLVSGACLLQEEGGTLKRRN